MKPGCSASPGRNKNLFSPAWSTAGSKGMGWDAEQREAEAEARGRQGLTLCEAAGCVTARQERRASRTPYYCSSSFDSHPVVFLLPRTHFDQGWLEIEGRPVFDWGRLSPLVTSKSHAADNLHQGQP